MNAVEQQTDPQMAALAALLRAGLKAEFGESILNSVFAEPVKLENISQSQKPSMCLYVTSAKASVGPSGRIDQRVMVSLEYVIDATKTERLDKRWPALRVVWNKILQIVWDGKHSAVDDGAEVLEAAGLYIHREQRPADARFSIANGTYPWLHAELHFEAFGEVQDATALNDFLQHHTAFDVVGGSFSLSDQDLTDDSTANATAPPLGYDLTNLDGYGNGS